MSFESALRLVVCVTLGSMAGMAMGGVFGAAAGRLSPGLFVGLMPFGPEIENPVGAAVVLGAAGGVCCGGALAAFALVLVRIDEWLKTRSSPRQADAG
ncbi:MAG: hypothetical protein AAF328_06090 [Planctomycetota bacterium]